MNEKLISLTSAWVLLGFASIANAVATMLIKRSRIGIEDYGIFALLASPFFLSGAVIFCINLILFSKVLEILPVSAAYPVFTGSGFVFVIVMSYVIFGERLDWSQYFGMVAVLLGVVLIVRPIS